MKDMIVVTHWDASSGKPVRVAQHIIDGDSTASELLDAQRYPDARKKNRSSSRKPSSALR